ncbi:putative Ig domain-containing protein [Spirosoma rhododendri]|nr:putative Ig domain-containing protein [Spirosoma rhododendri]
MNAPIAANSSGIHAYYPIDAGINCMDVLKDYGPNGFDGRLGNYAPVITPTQTNVSCFGGINGSATANVRSGIAPYSYSWTPTANSTNAIGGLAAGTYSLIVTDSQGCTATQGYTITQPAAVVGGTGVVTNVSCFGGSNGSINLTPSGGTAPYSFNWGGGIITEDRAGLVAGTYSVVITDANGCQVTRTFTITQPASAVSGTSVVTNIACNGASNGAINLTPGGGTAPYTFNWGGGITTEDRSGLVAGTYSVIITDANGCTASLNISVTQPASTVGGTGVATSVSCFGASNGSINLTPSGGTTPYTFNWGGGITTEDRTGLAAGTYSVIITDANGCTATRNFTVTQPASAVGGTSVVTNLACNGASNGAINLTPVGGTSPYTFNWGNNVVTEDRMGLAAGAYTVVITDAKGCTGSLTISVTQPTNIAIMPTTQTNVACNGGSNGSATVSVSGGAGSYSYSWSPSGGTSATATGLSAGAYTVEVTDASNCQATRMITITEPAVLAITSSQANPSAYGASDGSATASVSGGTAPYTYSWSSGGTGATAGGLSAGTYKVTVTDANGCQKTVAYTLTQPAASNDNSIGNLVISGGSLTPAFAPGTLTYSADVVYATERISLTPTVDPNATVKINGKTVTNQAAFSVPLSVGSNTIKIEVTAQDGTVKIYTLTVTRTQNTQTITFNAISEKTYGNTDFKLGAVASSELPIRYESSNPAVATVDADGTVQIIKVGTVDFTAAQKGNAIYTPALSVKQTLVIKPASLTIRADNQCENGSAMPKLTLIYTGFVNGETALNLIKQPTITTTATAESQAGTYPIIVQGAESDNYAIKYVNGALTIAAATLTADGYITCAKPTVTLTATGGVSYALSDGQTSTTGVFTVSKAGEYTVTVTTGEGCVATAAVAVSAFAAAPQVTLANDGPITCVKPVVTLTASPTLLNCASVAYAYSGPGLVDPKAAYGIAQASAAGVYSVTITDGYGCTATAETTVAADQQLPVVTLTSNGPLSCAKTSVTLIATGGVSYQFDGGVDTQSGNTAMVTKAGVYSVKATATNGCLATKQITVTGDQTAPTAGLTSNGPLTCDRPIVTLTASGGKTYRFGIGATVLGETTATVREAGIYSVTVTAANGCTAVTSTAVTGDQAVPTAELSNSGPLTCANAAVTLTATGKGSYRFSQGAAQIETGNTATVSAAGVYSVTVTAANGCTATAQSTVKANTDLPVVSLISNGPLTCAKPTATLTAGGTGTYRFSTGALQIDGGNTATVATAGVYSVTVTGENGCAAVATTAVELNSEIKAPTLTASALVTEKLPVQVTASGCTGTISWNVQGGTGVADGALYTLAQPANYTLTARCTVGACTSTDATPLVVSIRPGDFAIASVNTVSCLLVNASRGEYSVKFTPVYSGLTGAPVSFSVINEKLPTDAVAPYTLRLYSDNPTITLVAAQVGSGEARFAYSWRAVCSGNTGENRPPVATSIPAQQLIQNQPYQLDLTAYFADPDGQVLSFYAEGLPAGLSLTGGRISGTPSTAGVSQVTFTAIDPGSLQVSTLVSLNVSSSVSTPTPMPGAFAITGVTTVNCEVVSAGERRVSLMPQYSGLNGQPVAFSVKNETAPTTLAGPYSVRLYMDNPVVTLLATQSGSTVSYQYSWLAACGTTAPTPNPIPTNVAPVVAIPLASQTATVGRGYSLYISRNTFSDANGDVLTLSVGNLPAGLSYSSSLSAITGTPAQAGESMIQVTATDGGGLSVSTSFRLTIVAPTQPTPTPTPGTFAIASVNTVNCEVVSASERRVIFMPLYTGVDGQPITFAVKNEMASTTAPGPYALRVYTDNPTLTLTATQSGATVSYQYNWLAGCGTTTPVNPNPTPNPTPTNVAPVVAVALTDQSATTGQNYSLTIPAGTFTDANNDALTISVSGLPAGLNFTAGSTTITGMPMLADQSVIMVTATDAGGLLVTTSFKLTVVAPTQTTPMPTPNPTPGTFAIASVNTVNCEVLAGAERRVRFTPIYSGASGTPISFSIVNEMSTTTALGPYSLRVYTDNPTITLVAEQGGTVVSYRYEWLKGCNPNGRQGALETVRPLQVTVLGNPVTGESTEVLISGAEGQPVQVQIVDLLGHAVHQQSIPQAATIERLSLPLGRSQGLLLLRVSTPAQQQQIKLLRP